MRSLFAVSRSHPFRRRVSPEARFIAAVLLLLLAVLLLLRYLPVPFLLGFEWFTGNQPVRFLLGLLALGYALILSARGLRVPALLSLALFAVVAVEAERFIPWGANTAALPEEERVRVFTYNAATRDPEQLLAAAFEADADLICLQETPRKYRDAIFERGREKGYHAVYQHLRRDAGMGTLLLSRGEIIPVDTIAVPSARNILRRFLVVDTRLKGRTIRVLNVQLESMERRRELWGVVASWHLRRRQVEAVSKAIDGAPGMVILAGDCNMTPTDRLMRPLLGRLADSWRAAGSGLGGTWHRQRPWFRIDYILYRGFEGAANARRLHAGESDHLAYEVDLILRAAGEARPAPGS